MKPKIQVVRLAEFRTVSMGAEGSVLKAGPGTVTSAVGTGLTSIGVAAGASVVVVWPPEGTKTGRRVGLAVRAGATVGRGVGFGVGRAVGGAVRPGGGVVWHHSSGIPGEGGQWSARTVRGTARSIAAMANSKKPRPRRILPQSLHRKAAVASCGASSVVHPHDL